MRRIFVLALFACACVCGLGAQAVDTTVCAVMKNPKAFDGKIVRIKGTAVAGFDEFIVKDSSPCGYQVDGIWLAYPQGTKGKAGAVALVEVQPAKNYAGAYTAPTRAAVTLDKSKDFKQFDNLLSQTHNKGAGMCLGCTRYEVTATLTGRLDAVADAGIKRDKAGKVTSFGGFGNMNGYPARLVLQSVTDVTPKEIDISKSDAATKGDTATFAGTGDLYDPMVAAAKSVAGLAGTPAGEQAKKDVEVYPKPGEHNGVLLSYGPTNEAAARDEELSAKDSPDGIQYNCILNQGRLEGDSELRAIVHMGQHISDLKSPIPGNETAPMFVLEYNAWSMTAAAVVSSGQKYLTMPGGYLLWDTSWPMADRTGKMDDAIKGYLADYAALSR
jgi:hypothetical protein